MSNLSLLLKVMGQHEEAEPLCRCALEGREAMLGATHPDTLTSVTNLATLFFVPCGSQVESNLLYLGEVYDYYMKLDRVPKK